MKLFEVFAILYLFLAVGAATFALWFFEDCDTITRGNIVAIVTGVSICVILGIGVIFWGEAEHNKLPECDKNGHKFSTQDYYNVFEKTMELEQIVTDSHYEGKIEGNLETSSFFIWHSTSTNIEGSLEQREEYKYYYKTEDGGYKKTSIPVENTTVYYITDGEPYVEVWRQYGNYKFCSVCGEVQYDWTCNFYKLYVPQGSIAEEISIK